MAATRWNSIKINLRDGGQIRHARFTIDASKNSFGIGKLRHPFGRDESADFNLGYARSGKCLHESDFDICRDRGGLALQPVPGADFNYFHFIIFRADVVAIGS